MSCFTPISQIIWPFVHISKYRELKEYAKELEVRVSKLDDNDHRDGLGRFISEKQGTFE